MSDFHRRIHSCDIEDCSDSKEAFCSMGERVSEESADKAVKKVFAILGVDINKPESVEEFREDLRFGKKLRKLADHGTLALVALIFVGIGYAAFAGVASKVKGG